MASQRCCYRIKCKNGSQVIYCINSPGSQGSPSTPHTPCPPAAPGNVAVLVCGMIDSGTIRKVGKYATEFGTIEITDISSKGGQEKQANLCCFVYTCPNGDIRVECYRNRLGGPCVGLLSLGGWVCLLHLGTVISRVGQQVDTPNGKLVVTGVAQGKYIFDDGKGNDLTITELSGKKFSVKDGKLYRKSTGTQIKLNT